MTIAQGTRVSGIPTGQAVVASASLVVDDTPQAIAIPMGQWANLGVSDGAAVPGEPVYNGGDEPLLHASIARSQAWAAAGTAEERKIRFLASLDCKQRLHLWWRNTCVYKCCLFLPEWLDASFVCYWLVIIALVGTPYAWIRQHDRNMGMCESGGKGFAIRRIVDHAIGIHSLVVADPLTGEELLTVNASANEVYGVATAAGRAVGFHADALRLDVHKDARCGHWCDYQGALGDQEVRILRLSDLEMKSESTADGAPERPVEFTGRRVFVSSVGGADRRTFVSTELQWLSGRAFFALDGGKRVPKVISADAGWQLIARLEGTIVARQYSYGACILAPATARHAESLWTMFATHALADRMSYNSGMLVESMEHVGIGASYPGNTQLV